jgi:hypothetical protein
MAATHLDLFRSGNAGSAQLSRVRLNVPDPDIETFLVDTETWVRARSGGVSTYDAPQPSWRGPAWRLPAKTTIPAGIEIRSDAPGHWMWEAARDMPLDEYVAALEQINVLFARHP